MEITETTVGSLHENFHILLVAFILLMAKTVRRQGGAKKKASLQRLSCWNKKLFRKPEMMSQNWESDGNTLNLVIRSFIRFFISSFNIYSLIFI